MNLIRSFYKIRKDIKILKILFETSQIIVLVQKVLILEYN